MNLRVFVVSIGGKSRRMNMTQASIAYRPLRADEAHLLRTIDRSERIEGIYRIIDGDLRLEPWREEVPAWDPAQIDAYVRRLRGVIVAGGRSFAAWDEDRVVGIGTLDVSGVGGSRAVMSLDMLHVSAGYRGRGIGRRLTELVASEARSLGARDLYISATPTRRTVEVYLRMGARVLAMPDPEMLAREPEDIHLLLNLA